MIYQNLALTLMILSLKNCLFGLFGAHVDNKEKDMLVFGIGPTRGLEHTLTAEKNVFH